MPRSLLLILLLAASAGATEFRDPTRPWQQPVERQTVQPSRSFVVNAIFVSSRRRLAIVDGVRVRVGDSVRGAVVTDISKDQVTLEIAGRTVSASPGQASAR